MKVSQFSLVLTAALAGNALAVFQGTDEEFIKIISDGNVPDGIFPEEENGMLADYQNLRRLREPRTVGQRCGRNTPCVEGLDCVRAGIGNMCMPASCMEGVMQDFVAKHNLQDYPQRIMEGTGT